MDDFNSDLLAPDLNYLESVPGPDYPPTQDFEAAAQGSQPATGFRSFWATHRKKIIYITIATLVVAAVIALITHFTKKPEVIDPKQSTPAGTLRPKRSWEPPYTVVTALSDALKGGDFALLAADGKTPVNVYLTLTRDGNRGTIEFSGEWKQKPLTLVDRPTQADLVVAGFPITSDALLRYDDGHVTALRKNPSGAIEFADVDVKTADGKPVGLEEKVFTLTRGT